MANLLRAEFYKLFHSRYFGVTGLFTFFLSSILLLDSNGETANLFSASLYNTPLLSFLTIVFSVLFVGNDFEQGTLYSYISAGHKRSHVVFAKTLVYEIACFVILVFPLLIHGLAGVLFLDETLALSSDVWINMAIIALSVSAMCMLPLLFSFLFRDIGRTLVVPMVLFFLMIFLMNGEQAQIITKILPMGQLRLVSLGQQSLQFIVTDFLWISFSCLGAYFGFCFSDLK
ncbi:ABC transporter permease subunit [Bariatricus massiliensis]|uniref:ABC transporter permease subunit n=1 Tax=Bariatricus massiliensis TaxID=1745713 RepID=A0ABS8DDX7_9FIRM|nr:ABC transporter permease subunit [Bariatricus massiliensis]MCB7302735.1 ABC transporter permease subunit [Bariatricus massiliensis]MCB7373951.1 ABC transporter permease subunit [Bariatricus massiliensis]MCB7386621.1 ABC transporter permease subunit [Bariatricus massiliensis]MCB7410783.1 ABC transporter permease subunit [Bariatricus massiliensis]MCQ5251608.1 ABC transporter permease subunit [Bariatricus massiliensis]